MSKKKRKQGQRARRAAEAQGAPKHEHDYTYNEVTRPQGKAFTGTDGVKRQSVKVTKYCKCGNSTAGGTRNDPVT